MFGLAMIKLDKRQITTALVVLIAAILAALYYFDYIKLPAVVQPVPEKTQAELLNDFKTKLVAGELTNIDGVIVKVSGTEIVLATTDASGAKKEQNIILAANALIRRLTAPELKPGDELVPMIETFIAPSDLRAGDSVLLSLDRDGKSMMIDVMFSLPTSAVATNESQTAGATMEQSLIDNLINLKQKASVLMMTGSTLQIFGTIVGIEQNVLVVHASTTDYRLLITENTIITDLQEDLETKKMSESFIKFADLRAGDFAVISADKDAKNALLIIRQKAIEQNN